MGLELRGADADIPYDRYSYLPPSLGRGEPCYIWVTRLHANIATDDYGLVSAESRGLAERLGLMGLADRHRLALLAPAIPRPLTLCGPSVPVDPYTITLPRLAFSPAIAPLCARPDLKVNAVIDELRADLRSRGYDVRGRVFIDGFSAGSMFAQRYVLLHPERVLAGAMGQYGGAMTLPEPRYGATRLHWPVGVRDFRALAGRAFDREAYRRVPQLVYIGDRDTEHSTVIDPGVWATRFQVDLLNAAFGGADPERLGNQVRYLNGVGYREIRFRLYPGVGHTPRPMLGDVASFFARIRDRDAERR